MNAPIRPWVYCALIIICATSLNAASFWINEFHYDNTSYDEGEFVEIAGRAGVDLAGYTLTFYNGFNGSIYRSLELSGLIPNELNGYGALSFSFPLNGIQNGPDGIALQDTSNLLEFLSYEGSFSATAGLASGTTSVNIEQSESSSTPIGYSLQLIGSGTTGSDFSWTTPKGDSPGRLNSGQTFPVSTLSNTALLLAFSMTIISIFSRHRST